MPMLSLGFGLGVLATVLAGEFERKKRGHVPPP